ncbi:hypothetical protein [Actinomadura fibrosa]|uniref:Transposase n=1 Tax=Actinomadura fibrosa TaxID=111802 RepID=A0ABW2XHS1_9ACTN|nr:hypothetical protein [Actinomadura fibrosa]
MISEKPGRRMYLPIPRRTRGGKAGLDDAKVQYIRDVAAKLSPGAKAADVYRHIRYRQGRHDISRALVREVMGQDRQISQRRFRR